MYYTISFWVLVQIGRGKVGLTGNILVKSNIPKSKFDNVFHIRKSHRLYIHNVRKIHSLGFSVQGLWGKSLEFLGAFLFIPHHQNIIEWMPLSRGYDLNFILGSNICFPSRY